MNAPVLNVAAYKFTPMTAVNPDLSLLRADLRTRTTDLALKGTVLLAPEGINLFLAGEERQVDAFLSHLRSLPGLADLTVKRSYSDTVPFRKLLVKLKREIIPFGRADIVPERYTSPRVSPEELKLWLDEGRPVVLLDTRNTYEVELGTFTAARTLPLSDFRNLPTKLPEDLVAAERIPVVTFCTGGIRCEKAAPYLESLGLTNVYQLEGGILNYFEKVGSAHYTGACWVFDGRVGVTPDLRPMAPPPLPINAAAE